MAAFNRFNQFTDDLVKAKHDFSSHAFKIMMTNTAPVATSAVKADITEISAGGGYSAGGGATTITLSNSSGQEIVKGTNVVFSFTGAAGPFRYAVLYNATQTTPNNPLIGWWDYGQSVSYSAGESFTVDTAGDATDVLFTLG